MGSMSEILTGFLYMQQAAMDNENIASNYIAVIEESAVGNYNIQQVAPTCLGMWENPTIQVVEVDPDNITVLIQSAARRTRTLEFVRMCEQATIRYMRRRKLYMTRGASSRLVVTA